MIEMNDQTLGFVLRQFGRACGRAQLCVAHYDETKKDSDRSEALFAIGEASGIRNLLRHLTRDLPTHAAEAISHLDQEVTRLKFVGERHD